jgi:hypothetical protein
MENVTKQEAYAEIRRWAWKLREETIYTVDQQKPNTVVGVGDKGVTVQARTTNVVGWQLIESVVDVLLSAGSIERRSLKTAGVPGAYRSAFTLSFLACTSFAEYSEASCGL